MPEYRYSLGTNVNTPFSQVPTLEIGHKRGHRIRLQIVFVQSSEAVHFFVLGSKLMFQNDIWQREME